MNAGLRRLAVLAAAVAVALATLGAPAQAHPAGVQLAVDYLTRVDGVTPAVPEVSVRFVADGSRLELRNDTGQVVEVGGYEGEPMLQIRPDGVWRNVRSPSWYIDLPASAEKAAADAKGAAQWQQISGRPVVRWHDHRTVWHGSPPPQVRADPSHRHRVVDWTVPLRVAGGSAQIAGTVDWLPPPNAGTWWTVVLLLTIAIGCLGLVRTPASSRSASSTRLALAAIATITGLVAITFAVSLVVANADRTPGGVAIAVAAETLPILTGLVLVLAAVLIVAQRVAANFALALAGVATAVADGFASAAVFSHPVPPIPADGLWVRMAEAIILGGGLGLAIAGTARLFREARESAASQRPA